MRAGFAQARCAVTDTALQVQHRNAQVHTAAAADDTDSSPTTTEEVSKLLANAGTGSCVKTLALQVWHVIKPSFTFTPATRRQSGALGSSPRADA